MKNFLAAALVAGWFAGGLVADEPTPDALVADLAHPEYARREAAHRRLEDLGAAALTALEKAAQSADAEQRLRAEQLLLEIRRATLWRPTTVTLGPGSATAEEAFRELEKQSKNPFKWTASTRGLDATVNLDGKPRTYWEALDELCRKTELAVNFYDDPTRAGGVVGRQQPGKFPVCYVGPFRARVQSIRRNLHADIHFADGESDVQDAWTLTLQLHWEQKALVARRRGKPMVLEALTDAGDDMRPKSNQSQRRVWMPLMARSREISHPIDLTPPSGKATKLKSLRIASEFVAVGDLTVLRVPLDRPGGAVAGDGYRLSVESLERRAPEAVVAVARIVRTEPLDMAINAPDLVDERLSVYVDDAEIPFAVQRTTATGRTSVDYVVQMRAPLGPNAEMRLEVPKLRAVKRFEFAFRDVPLP